ncbi:MAG: winged helix-turn-helix transcriptional regulator [Clostridiales bacterium]|nr:winged helix-turn-helix transcriptional regulator [Clostridiales bacterium]
MININEPKNASAQKLLRAFSQFRKIHWKPPHVKELKPSEFMVLHAVKHSFLGGENGLMVSELSNILKVARPTVTQLVNSLQQKGFLDKCTDEHDKRVVRINLSEKGKTLAKQGSDEFYRRFEGLTEHLGDKKSLELANLLQEVFEYFKETESKKG